MSISTTSIPHEAKISGQILPLASSQQSGREERLQVAEAAIPLLLDDEVRELREALLVRKDTTGLRFLGRGKYGDVYRFKARSGFVAIKLSKVGIADSFTQLIKEHELGQKLRHPLFVRHDQLQIHARGMGSQRAFLSMEFLSEPPLESVLHRLTLRDLAEIAEQIGEAATYAIGQRVVLLDLSPDNVHVGEGNRIRIIDFGMYKALDRETIIGLWEALSWQYRYVEEWASPEENQNSSKLKEIAGIRDWLKSTYAALYKELRKYLFTHRDCEPLCIASTLGAQSNLTTSLWDLVRSQEQIEAQ